MMNRYYTKKSYFPVNRTQHIGAQSAERESFRETRQIRTPRGRKRKVWKCDECGIVLKDNQGMLRRHPNHILCLGCHAEQPGKNHRKLKKKRM